MLSTHYSKLYIIQGVPLDVYYIRKYTERHNLGCKNESDWSVITTFNEKLSAGGYVERLYPFPNCSKIKHLCILGEKVREYDRRWHFCFDCKKNATPCDTCIGYTSNGFYNVKSIQDDVEQVNMENLCLKCGHDQRYPLKAFCLQCGSKPGFEKQRNNVNYICRQYLNLENPEIAYYYMLNDCLNCNSDC